jgi:hypothetical protein
MLLRAAILYSFCAFSRHFAMPCIVYSAITWLRSQHWSGPHCHVVRTNHCWLLHSVIPLYTAFMTWQGRREAFVTESHFSPKFRFKAFTITAVLQFMLSLNDNWRIVYEAQTCIEGKAYSMPQVCFGGHTRLCSLTAWGINCVTAAMLNWVGNYFPVGSRSRSRFNTVEFYVHGSVHHNLY